MLAKVFDHVVTLELAMNENIEPNLLLFADALLGLLLQEIVVLGIGDCALLVCSALLTNLLCLRKRTNRCRRQQRKTKLFPLHRDTLLIRRSAPESSFGQRSEPFANNFVGAALSSRPVFVTTAVFRKCSSGNFWPVGKPDDLFDLLLREAEPAQHSRIELAFIGRVVRNVQQRA